MLRTERSDYRRSDEAGVLAGLRSQDPLALAEAYHRTSAAAHACARRLLGGARPAEALMQAVYDELWASPPETTRLEGWVRARCFRIGAAHLRERGEPPASPSLALLLPGLPQPESTTLDAAEQALAGLTEAERLALLLAHDQGVPATSQDALDAVSALDRALVALAGPGEGVEEATAQSCADLTQLADWTLGLLEEHEAARIAAEVADRTPCAARSRALRRGRRRIEGLPPAPDMGQRILASVLTDGGPRRQAGESAPNEGSARSAARPAPSALGAPPQGAPSGTPPAGAGVPLSSALDGGVESPWDPVPTGADTDADEQDAPTSTPPDPTEDLTGARPSDADERDEQPDWSDRSDGPEEALAVGGEGIEPGEDTIPGPAAAEGSDAAAESQETDEEAEESAAGGGRVLHRVLSVIAVIVVLVAGAALGILIGLQVVR